MNTDTKELDYKAVQKMIKQAIVLRRAKLSSNTNSKKFKAFPEMTESLGEQLYSLLVDKDPKTHQDWGSQLWGFKNLMQQLLILLAKPGVLAMLPEHSQPDAAHMLDKLVDFFDMVDHDDTHAFLDYEMCGYIDDAEKLKWLSDYYNFDKRREHKYHSHFFGDLAREEKWERNAVAYKNAHFTDK